MDATKGDRSMFWACDSSEMDSQPTEKWTSPQCKEKNMKKSTLTLSLLLCCTATWARADYKTQPQDVTFQAKCDGTRQRYVVLLPEGFDAEKPHHLLVALHGHGSDRWQFANSPRDECRVTRDVAAAGRMIFVSPDYRAKTSWMGPKAEADVLQIIEALKDKYKVGKVIVAGGSMGGSSALSFAAMHPELVDGVVSMNGTANHLEYENFQEAIRESFGGGKAHIPAEYKRRSAEYWPERLTMPIGITAGGKDTSVPPTSVLRLADVLKKIGRPVLVVYRENEGHRTNYADGKQTLDFIIQKATGG